MRKTQKIVATALSAAVAASMCVAAPATAAFADGTAGATAASGTDEVTPIDENVMWKAGAQFYDGEAQTPYSKTWKNEKTYEKLTEGVDYTVEYKDNIEKGTATATITGIGKYSGTFVKTFDIVEFSLDVSYTNAEGKSVSLGAVSRSKIDALLKNSTDNNEPQTYLYGDTSKGYTVVYVPAKCYLTYNTVMREVGNVSSWKSATAEGTDQFKSLVVTSEMNEQGKYYPAASTEGINTMDAKSVPAAVVFSYSTAKVQNTAAQAAEAAAAKTPEKGVMLAVGWTEQNVKEKSLMGKYFAHDICKFNIGDFTALKTNPVKVAKAKATVKKGKTVAVKVSKAQGKVSAKSSKKSVAKVSYSKKTGKVTIKGVKKGKATITVSAAGNKDYKAGTKTIKVTVK